MIKRLIKAYRRRVIMRAIKSLGPTAEILAYNASDNKFFVKYKVGKSTIRSLVYYRPSDHKVVFESGFDVHPDF